MGASSSPAAADRRPASDEQYAAHVMIRRLAAFAGVLTALTLPLAMAFAASPLPPGPPFPSPEINRAVYDQAGVLSAATIATLESEIDAIETRTGAEVVVYTQVWPYKIDQETSQMNAAALIDQWGIGRRGFDDSLVILFDLDPSLVHGQVSLFAGSGFRAAFLSDSERQQIFDNDMVPLLAAGDLNGAALIALNRVSAAATPEHARQLELARQVNAIVGIIGGALVLLLLPGWAIFHWLRFGRDPVYIDSESVLVPAPPTGMTAAAGTLVLDGHTSRRSLTTALLDLASRGQVAFRQDKGFLGLGGTKLAIDVGSRAATAARDDVAGTPNESIDAAPATAVDHRVLPGLPGLQSAAKASDPGPAVARSRLALANRKPTSAAEAYLLARLKSLASGDTIEAGDVAKLATDVPTFEHKLEDAVVGLGWFARRPSAVVARWRGIGVVELVIGGVLAFAGVSIPASGLTVVGITAIIAGVLTFLVASAMPARTMAGAMQRAWLHAYRRTLSKTMDQARSMDQVVQEAGLDWLETPDQAVVWSVALGLVGQVEDVLGRTMADSEADGSQAGYMPLWYRGNDGSALVGGGGSASGGGLFSSSGVPDLGGMFSVLGTVGNAPSSSGSSGGGGFGGGGSGGGGGAGGGF